MYPFSSRSSIVRNRWYIAAFADEISREPMERKLLGLPVALYRKENGEPVAMYGLCPHRYFPVVNGGDLAILFCFVFLYFSAAGPGSFSLDQRRSLIADDTATT